MLIDQVPFACGGTFVVELLLLLLLLLLLDVASAILLS